MKIELMQPGQIVYDLRKIKMGNTKCRTLALYTVRIVSVDLERRKVRASWNTNLARDYSEKYARKWLKNKPILVPTAMGGFRRQNKSEKE